MTYIAHSDSLCPNCGAKLVINSLSQWRNDITTEHCHCYNCDNDVDIVKSIGGTVLNVNIE